MAFKPSPKTPEEIAQAAIETQASLRRMHDRTAFGAEDPRAHQVHIVAAPVVEPLGTKTHIKARDEQGIVMLVLGGDRSPDTVFEPRTEALMRAMNREEISFSRLKEGVPSNVQGVEAKTGFDGQRDPKGQFRTIFVETMDFTVDGQTYSYGRPREPERVLPSAEVILLHAAKPAVVAEQQGQTPAQAAAEDTAIFGTRRQRPLDFVLTGEGKPEPDGGMRFAGHNARGPVDVVLPGSRGESARSNTALQEGLARGISVQAEGIFVSRQVPEKSERAWDFVASTVAFEAQGQSHTLGRPVAQAVAEVAAEKPAPRRGRDGDVR